SQQLRRVSELVEHLQIRRTYMCVALQYWTYGRLGVAAEKLLRICADKIALTKRIPKASVLFYWRSRLSMLLQQMLARACQERFLNIQNPSLRAGDDECFQVDFQEVTRVD